MVGTAYFWFLILDPVGFINDYVSPVELLHYGLLTYAHLIGGYAHVPFTWYEHISYKGSLDKLKKYKTCSN